MSDPKPSLTEALIVVWVLAATAGFVVSVAYQVLVQVEVGPMTGNMIATAQSVARHGAFAPLTRAVPIAGFVVGMAIGIVIVEESTRHGRHRALGFLLVLEVLLLIAFMVWTGSVQRGEVVHLASHWELDALILLPSIALGLQTAALRRVGGQTTRTVYMTGMLTRATEEAVRLVYWRRDRARGETEVPWRNEPTVRRVALLGGIVLAYGTGALLGAWGNSRWPAWSLLVPIVALVLVVAVDAALRTESLGR